MSNKELDRVSAYLKALLKSERIEWRREIILKAMNALENGINIAERDIDNALNGALRGSEFPGDMVGRPADDFADYYGDDYVYRKKDDDSAAES